MIKIKKNPKHFSLHSIFHFMLLHPFHWLAQGFGSGLSPIMPGTAGTFLAWCIYEILSMNWPTIFTTLVWLIIIHIGFVFGIFICNRTGQDLDILDHNSIVWDEIIAFWLVLVFLSPTNLSTQFYAFIIFRFFDIIKPIGISYFDKHFKNGFSVMFDDIIAAFYTLLIFVIWRDYIK